MTPPRAYPMPDITYALVPTAPQAPAQAKAMKDLLTNLVDVSNGDGAAPLPPGYYPLPTSMYQTALGDINSDITAAPSTPTTTPTTTPVAVPPGSVQPTSQPSTATDTSPGSSGSTSPFDSGSPDDQTLPLSSLVVVVVVLSLFAAIVHGEGELVTGRVGRGIDRAERHHHQPGEPQCGARGCCCPHSSCSPSSAW